jgi:hypothetical protein
MSLPLAGAKHWRRPAAAGNLHTAKTHPQHGVHMEYLHYSQPIPCPGFSHTYPGFRQYPMRVYRSPRQGHGETFMLASAAASLLPSFASCAAMNPPALQGFSRDAPAALPLPNGTAPWPGQPPLPGVLPGHR